jgi:hypothetical protein
LISETILIQAVERICSEIAKEDRVSYGWLFELESGEI